MDPEDLGDPISYLVLAQHTTVYDSAGERVGEVDRVLADTGEDIFDGIVVRGDHGRCFVDAGAVGPLHERGVLLRLSAAELAQLPEPSSNPAVMRTGPDDMVAAPTGLAGAARRLWSRLSGRR